jgi:hypothetical protein
MKKFSIQNKCLSLSCQDPLLVTFLPKTFRESPEISLRFLLTKSVNINCNERSDEESRDLLRGREARIGVR